MVFFSGEPLNARGLGVIACAAGLVGFMGGNFFWQGMSKDVFRVYSNGITDTRKRRHPDGRWSSFVPKGAITRVAFERVGLMDPNLVFYFNIGGPGGQAMEIKSAVSTYKATKEAADAVTKAFSEKWTDDSRKYMARAFATGGTEAKGQSADGAEPGALLDEETPEEAARLKGKLTLVGTALASAGAILLVPGILLMPFMFGALQWITEDIMFLPALPVIAFTFAGVGLIWGLGLLIIGARRRPWRIHENGIAASNRLSGREVFTHFKDVNGIREETGVPYGKLHRVFLGSAWKSIIILPDERTDARIEMIRNRSTRPEVWLKNARFTGTPAGPPAWAVIRYSAYLGAGILGAGFFIFMDTAMVGGDGLRILLWAFPAATAFALMALFEFEHSTETMRGERTRFRPRAAYMFFTAPVVLLFVMLLFGGSLAAAKYHYIPTDPAPETGVELALFQPNSSFTLDDNLVVRSGEALALHRNNLTFACREDREFQLWVEKGGSLVAENCSFSGSGYHGYFGCELFGSAVFINCSFERMTNAEGRYRDQGGIVIRSSDVRFEGCTQNRTLGVAVLIVDSAPVFDGCHLGGGYDSSVEAYRASPTFRNCTFAGWKCGLAAWDGSRVTLQNCTFKSNHEAGILLESSEVMMSNCRMEDQSGAAIVTHPPASVAETAMTYVNVAVRRAEGPPLAYLDACCLTGNLMAVVMAPAYTWAATRHLTAEDKQHSKPDL
jgi:hypothetical protein